MLNTEQLITEVSPNDEMYLVDPEWYFQLGTAALESIDLAMRATGRTGFWRILDMPSGHGRVLRALKAAFPDAHLSACDIDEDAVAFCARVFGATPIVSREDPAEIELDGPYDLIWCGSLLTHVDAERWPRFLELFREHLSDYGLLLFSAHGRFAAELVRRGKTYGLPAGSPEALLNGFVRKGFGYAEYAQELKRRIDVPTYGVSLSAPGWVFGQVERQPGLLVVSYAERAWGDHDVVACMREPLPGLGAERALPDAAVP